MLRLAIAKPPGTPFPILFAAESEASPARLAWFERGADPKQLWLQSKLDAIPPLRNLEALVAADLNADLRPDLAVSENAGQGSRLVIYWAIDGSKYQGSRIDVTNGLLGLWALDYDGDGGLDLVGLGSRSVTVWRNQRRR
jgi:hypothetical protein